MDKQELDLILEKHELWLKDEDGGERADLSEAYLRGANLSEAYLRGANLSEADLRGADLGGADLRRAIGNGKEIKTISIEKYTISYTKDRMQIGCKNYSYEEWFSFSNEEIYEMDNGALDWWNKYKDWLKQTIELSPAEGAV